MAKHPSRSLTGTSTFRVRRGCLELTCKHKQSGITWRGHSCKGDAEYAAAGRCGQVEQAQMRAEAESGTSSRKLWCSAASSFAQMS